MINNFENLEVILEYQGLNPNDHVANVYIEHENRNVDLEVKVINNNGIPYIFIDGVFGDDITNNCFSPNDYFFSLSGRNLKIEKESFKILVTPLTR